MSDATTDLLAGVKCLCCNEEIELMLRLSECREFRCYDCDGEFDVADLEARIAGYERLIRMANAAKVAAEQGEGE